MEQVIPLPYSSLLLLLSSSGLGLLEQDTSPSSSSFANPLLSSSHNERMEQVTPLTSSNFSPLCPCRDPPNQRLKQVTAQLRTPPRPSVLLRTPPPTPLLLLSFCPPSVVLLRQVTPPLFLSSPLLSSTSPPSLLLRFGAVGRDDSSHLLLRLSSSSTPPSVLLRWNR